METWHRAVFSDAREMESVAAESIDLVVTSPPYPMIEMWDNLFARLSYDVKMSIEQDNGNAAFEAMHAELDKVWRNLYRVLKAGAFLCVNIGDATRTIGGRFQLYPNHARIISACRGIGFDTLPAILWRKQTNAPNKFMGSGTLPSGAYVTLEHEYILVFRKGPKRAFTTDSGKSNRMRSSFFWEERNKWFSDVWDFKGTPQELARADMRNRSAAFPLALAYRLVNMYSLYNDIVMDPFMGTGTTALAAMACGRNSIGIEIDKAFSSLIVEQAKSFASTANRLLSDRVSSHAEFMAQYAETRGPPKYRNDNHGFPVVTRQEQGIELFRIARISEGPACGFTVEYEPMGKLEGEADRQRERLRVLNDTSQQVAVSL